MTEAKISPWFGLEGEYEYPAKCILTHNDVTCDLMHLGDIGEHDFEIRYFFNKRTSTVMDVYEIGMDSEGTVDPACGFTYLKDLPEFQTIMTIIEMARDEIRRLKGGEYD